MTAPVYAPVDTLAGPRDERLRLTRGLHDDGAGMDLAAHVGTHGPLSPGGDVLVSAEAVDLRGRGGAAFPFARKARAVRAAGGRPVVVGNGSEGEPASRKDAALLRRAPHLVLDGLQLAAGAVGAREARLVIGDGEALHAVLRALRERVDAVPTEVRRAPARFVAGESSAAVRVASGAGPALPAFTVKPTAAGGVDGRPTLVSNVETLAHLAVLARTGPGVYAELGTPGEPGTTLLTVHTRGARVVEVPFGTPLREVVDGSEAWSGVLVGGYHGTWVPPRAACGAVVSRAGLAAVGGALGAGVVVASPLGCCPLVESAPVVRRLAAESAGQCGPCVLGLASIATAVSALAEGSAAADDVRNLLRWCGLVEGRGACGHPDGVARFVRSLLSAFPDDVSDHLDGGCGRAFTGLLPLGELS